MKSECSCDLEAVTAPKGGWFPREKAPLQHTSFCVTAHWLWPLTPRSVIWPHRCSASVYRSTYTCKHFHSLFTHTHTPHKHMHRSPHTSTVIYSEQEGVYKTEGWEEEHLSSNKGRVWRTTHTETERTQWKLIKAGAHTQDSEWEMAQNK